MHLAGPALRQAILVFSVVPSPERDRWRPGWKRADESYAARDPGNLSDRTSTSALRVSSNACGAPGPSLHPFLESREHAICGGRTTDDWYPELSCRVPSDVLIRRGCRTGLRGAQVSILGEARARVSAGRLERLQAKCAQLGVREWDQRALARFREQLFVGFRRAAEGTILISSLANPGTRGSAGAGGRRS